MSTDREAKRRQCRGFTQLDLLAVLTIMAVLALPLVPALAREASRSKTMRCLQNLRSVMTALTMYSQDSSSGRLPPNPDDANAVAGHHWCGGMAGSSMANEYDPDLLKDNTQNLVATYLGQTSAFSCTADPRPSRAATGASAFNQAYRGQLLRPARSISMNGAVGTICNAFSAGGGHDSSMPVLPVNGPWLDNTHDHKSGRPYATFSRLSSTAMQPAKLWIVIEEAPASLNDASFGLGLSREEWMDFPAYNHDYGAALAFADGHSELRKWTDPGTGRMTSRPTSAPGSRDWAWMTERTSVKVR